MKVMPSRSQLRELVRTAAISGGADSGTLAGFDAFFTPFLAVADEAIGAVELPVHLHASARSMAMSALRDLLLPVASAAFAPQVPRPRGSLSALVSHMQGAPRRDQYVAYLLDGGVAKTWHDRPVFTDMGAMVTWNLVLGIAEGAKRAAQSRQVGAPVTEIGALASDRHRGRSVLKAVGPAGCAAYRPRDTRLAEAIHGWLVSHAVPGMHPLVVESFPGYGFLEWATVGGDPVVHARGLGAWWTLLTALGAGDIHHENLIVSALGVSVVDLEVINASFWPGEPPIMSWPRAETKQPADLTMLIPGWTWDRNGELVDSALLAGSMSRISPVPVPIVQSPGTDATRLLFIPRRIDVAASFSPWTSADLADAFEVGANQMGEVLSDEGAVAALRLRLEGRLTRVLMRDTIVYSQLLWGLMLDPSVKEDEDARAALAELARLPTRDGSPPTSDCVGQEIEALLVGDVPYFEEPLKVDELSLAAPAAVQRSIVTSYLRVPRRQRLHNPSSACDLSPPDRALRALEQAAVHFDDGSIGWLGSRWTEKGRFTTAPLPWGLFDGHAGVLVGLTMALRAGIMSEPFMAQQALARIVELDPQDVVDEHGLSLSQGLAGVTLGLCNVRADWPQLESVADRMLTALERSAATRSMDAWDFDDGVVGAIWALQILGRDIPDRLWDVVPTEVQPRGLAHGDAGLALVTGASPRPTDSLDARPCWGAPGVAMVALRLGLDKHPSIGQAMEALAAPIGDEPGTLCCGTAGRLLASRELGMDFSERSERLALQADRVVQSSSVPQDSWVPGLRYGLAGLIVTLATLADRDVAVSPLLADYRRVPRSIGVD